jgi:hypothetical protein
MRNTSEAFFRNVDWHPVERRLVEIVGPPRPEHSLDRGWARLYPSHQW